ncbi:flagellar biosynthetic protein FliR [Proteiniborus sp. MB09-C3]|uniref:flagellar biosynthetic protein FliR n=1 Tax=Proteiniborus sp. MB09-C3 TaxID=3050072 RepID=UPI00255293CA|nr:flagellar biosynthetic protein FliR [Proteiniborus sp. MB09-C3]WIV10872.1 flagellar biosynthetic protein FliR [Proteiniborus sp. MB09-C3]
MEALLIDTLNKYQIFLLILVRMAGLFLITPIFSRNNIPNVLKIGFSFFCSIILVNVMEVEILNLAPYELILFSIKELLVGLMLGFISYLFFTTLYLAGQVIDMQTGFGMVNVLDPQQNIQVPIMGTFYYIITVLVFLIIDGHHTLLEALVKSYEYVPIGQFRFSGDMINQLVRILTQTFIVSFKISGPVLAAIFLTDVLLGILAKTMPQMNVFIVGMPLKIFIGIATIIITLPLFIATLQNIFSNMYEEIFNFLKVIQKG